MPQKEIAEQFQKSFEKAEEKVKQDNAQRKNSVSTMKI